MSFARSLATVSGLTIVSRVAGFIRDTLTATFLGAGPVADAFFVAQRLPNLFRSLFAEGAFTAAFVPLYATEAEKNGPAAAQRFAGQALTLLALVLTPFSLLIMLFMPTVIQIMAPGFQDDGEKYALAVTYSRITFPYLLLISLTALQSGVLNARGFFGPPAAAPVALNLVLIGGLLGAYLFGWDVGLTLAIATTLSGLVQAMWLWVSCHRAGAAIPMEKPRLSDMTKRLFQQIGPGAIGAGAAQINLLMSTILASLLPTGAVSYLYYADRLNQLPLGIVGIAVATTLLPVLSRHLALGDRAAVRHYTARAVEFCLILGLPAMIGLILAGGPIIQTLFEHGAFGAQDRIETTKALAAYAVGIPAFLLVKVYAANFFARHDTKTPVRFAIIAMITNVICSLLLIGLLEHVGIALATSIATWTNAALLFNLLRQKGEPLSDALMLRRLPRILIAALGMAVMIFGLVQWTLNYFAGDDLWRHIAGLLLIMIPSCVGYVFLLHITRAFSLSDARAMFVRAAKTGPKPDPDPPVVG